MNEEYNTGKSERELLEELVSLQKKDAVKQMILIIVIAALTVVLTVSAAIIIPKAVNTITKVDAAVESLQDSIGDIDHMVNSVGELVDTNMDSVSDALKMITELDLDSLNNSIGSLSDILSTLQTITNIFK